jgi:hypothetical protein
MTAILALEAILHCGGEFLFATKVRTLDVVSVDNTLGRTALAPTIAALCFVCLCDSVNIYSSARGFTVATAARFKILVHCVIG